MYLEMAVMTERDQIAQVMGSALADWLDVVRFQVVG